MGARPESAALRKRRIEHPPVEPAPWAPKYVHACHADLWTIHLRHINGGGKKMPYRCMSRHHDGPCRDAWRRRLFVRLATGRLADADPANVALITLTLPSGWHHDVTGNKRLAANRILGKQYRSWIGKVRKRLERSGYAKPEYYWFREDHKSGMPHVHVVVISKYICDILRARDEELAGHTEIPEADRNLVFGWLAESAVDSGFGPRFDGSVARSKEAISSYLTKLPATVGEVTKGGQAPEMLPRHTRSYGYTRGFLAPREKDEGWMGWLQDEHGRTIERPRTIEKIYDEIEKRSNHRRAEPAGKMAAGKMAGGVPGNDGSAPVRWTGNDGPKKDLQAEDEVSRRRRVLDVVHGRPSPLTHEQRRALKRARYREPYWTPSGGDGYHFHVDDVDEFHEAMRGMTSWGACRWDRRARAWYVPDTMVDDVEAVAESFFGAPE